MSTKTAKPAPPDIGALGMLRWAWRQLTTMRTALILLLILALASIPGSLLPQRIQDPAQVTQYIEDNPRIGPFLDAVQLFDVYASVWFAAIYILLMVSLVGCVLPRSKQHYKAMRQAPPPAPRRLSRMPGYQAFTASGTAEDMLTAAEARLKKLGYRTTRRGDAISAERGYLRETGNLLFHICLLGVTVTMAVGALIGYSGQRILVEGDTFTNSLVAYDSFEPGSYFSADRLDDYRLRLNSFDASFDDTAAGNQFGQPRAFNADVTTIQDGQETDHSLRVNEPIRIDGSRVYLTGNGYAPVITVRDGDGNVTYSGPVVFLPQDGVYTSRGVVKVPDASPDQLGFVGILLPTASQNEKGELVSQFAELRNPYLVMNVFAGDLGLDAGVAQSVYELDTDNLDQLAGPDGQPLQLYLKPGETTELPDGLGSVELEEIKRYVALDIRHDPTQGIMLAFTIFLLAGLGLSLFVPRRRMWVRAADTDDGVATEVASLARGEDPRVVQAAESLAVELNNSPSRKA
ncbi:cytochrome c biogenesis protein ResB [Brevibacterium sp. p3-SID960]|uniref:cytochrome c biogenesis protein ResB n=1 Tax=Brevibacterium sp. p3-SID960 TaxID=2916063 RepID=UPI0021A6580C|nr:cytochrome c biogenesis protein ResB [Brevibacterium sp. p3-SID960]MCT1689567.1 cytochrome c biogenesis protein ResB [Brevibacterium sp. p3-SID960]